MVGFCRFLVPVREKLKNTVTWITLYLMVFNNIQDFFAELRLPYSVKRGERFPLNVTIFNYIDVSSIRKEIAQINGL